MGQREPKIEVVEGEVIAKANHYQAVPDKTGGKRIIKDKAIRDYEKSFLRQCQVYRDRNISKPFIFKCRIYYSTMAHDLDNSLKTVLDCLQYCKAIKNDNLCIRIDAQKFIDKRRPRIEFIIEETQPKLF